MAHTPRYAGTAGLAARQPARTFTRIGSRGILARFAGSSQMRDMGLPTHDQILMPTTIEGDLSWKQQQ